MKINISDVSDYLFNEGIENKVAGNACIRISRDSVAVNNPTLPPDDANTALLNDINETFQGKFQYFGHNDDYLFLEQISS